MGTSRQRDGEWLDLVADLMERPLTAWPAETIVEKLIGSLDAADGVFYDHVDGAALRLQWNPHTDPAHQKAIECWTAETAAREHPVLRYYLATARSEVMQVADVPPAIVGRRGRARWLGLCDELLGRDVRDQVSLPLRMGPTGHRAFVIARPGRYGSAEMTMARRLGRVLTGLDRQIDAHRRWGARTGPLALDAATAAGLTPREAAVLDLLAQGLTARAMGRRLAIAERTVQKHLQRIYAKLAATDRLAAVQRAQLIGLLPPGT